MNSETGIMNIADERYEESVSNLAERASSVIFKNKGESHAEIVLRNIIKTSKEELYILAESLTSKLTNCKGYKNELVEYIESRYGKLKVLIEEKPEEVKENTALATISYLQQLYPHNIEVRLLTEEVKNISEKKVNFTVGDGRMFRLETDTQLRSAYCCFNNEEISSNLIQVFEGFWCSSDPVNSLNIV